jgi:hypothetical protein
MSQTIELSYRDIVKFANGMDGYYHDKDFKNAMIEDSTTELTIVSRNVIKFTEKLPSQIKKLNLYCIDVKFPLKKIQSKFDLNTFDFQYDYEESFFDDVESLYLSRYHQNVIDMLKTNTKLKKFSFGKSQN